MDENKREYYFRCHYQKGEICVPVVKTSGKAISAPEILIALCELAVKVKDNVSPETGGRVALEVLSIHEHFIKTIKYLKVGTGASKSYPLNRKSNKRDNRTERVDLEFFGEYGIDDKNHSISKYIELYRQMKDWHD